MSATAPAYRNDIQGLRGLSVLMVLLFHVDHRLLPGGFFGVDVFFVISGFIITTILLREVESTGTIDWLRFIGRRAKRLLPNASLVLVATTVAAVLVLSPFEFAPVSNDITSAALYYSNFHFAQTSVDYFLSNRNPSPVVHFWSLSIEEQFYFVWPLLLLLTTMALPARKVVPALAVLLSLIVFGSFWFALHTLQTSQPLAFFHSGSRIWELGAGALLAVALLQVRAPVGSGLLRSIVGGAGVLAIGASAYLLTDQIAHPGWWTLLPVFGAAAAILAGSMGPSVITAVLAWKPMVWMGDRSYSLYLWHWPVIVFAGLMTDQAWWSPWVALAASVLLAELAFRYVETPIRRRNWNWRGAVGAIGAAAAVIVATALLPTVAIRGPELLNSEERTAWATRISTAASEYGEAYDANCHLDSPRLPQPTCLFGDPASDRKIVLLGDSHAAHWFPAVKRAAVTTGWRVHSWTKSSCPAASILVWQSRQRAPYVECSEWRDEMLARIAADEQVKVVILSSSSGYPVTAPDRSSSLSSTDSDAELVMGTVRTIDFLQKLGKRVVLINDTPVARVEYKDCMLANLSGEGCGRARDQAMNTIEEQVLAQRPTVTFVDVSDIMCGVEICPVIINDQIVYRDDSHMSASFAEGLAPVVMAAIERAYPSGHL